MKKLNVKVGEIYSFKMNSSEEIIATVHEVNEDTLIIEQPVSIGPTSNGQMGLIPSLFTYDHTKKLTINTNSIAIVAETDDAIKTKYIQATTGLTVPEKKVIMG